MTGDVIYVFGEMDEDGFYMGQVAASGARGLVPSNFLADAVPDPVILNQMMMHQHPAHAPSAAAAQQLMQQPLNVSFILVSCRSHAACSCVCVKEETADRKLCRRRKRATCETTTTCVNVFNPPAQHPLISLLSPVVVALENDFPL